jgi:hypothetical protein
LGYCYIGYLITLFQEEKIGKTVNDIEIKRWS